MHVPRRIRSSAEWLDENGIKIYTISYSGTPVDHAVFVGQLKDIKKSRDVAWDATPAFAIFHEGKTYPYLILAWWANDNELFTSVSVKVEKTWIEDREKYSFCIYDLPIMWAERNFYVKCIDCSAADITAYRTLRFPEDPTGAT